MTLLGERVFADIVKDLGVRVFWITLGPKSNDRCVVRDRREKTHRHGGDGRVRTEAEVGEMGPQELEEQGILPLEPLEEA